jgi:ABC-type Na+ efflux pump permease subunit
VSEAQTLDALRRAEEANASAAAANAAAEFIAGEYLTSQEDLAIRKARSVAVMPKVLPKQRSGRSTQSADALDDPTSLDADVSANSPLRDAVTNVARSPAQAIHLDDARCSRARSRKCTRYHRGAGR